MSTPAIIVEQVGKRYRLGAVGATSLREEAMTLLRRLRGEAPRAAPQDFWALRDVSLTVNRGEVVGLIGRNGAGKSTLLKILSRITEPTLGCARLRGRVASLLEVGTGFHPELTGRENVYLNGAILGMTRAEVRRKFDEIVAFAEIDAFIDTPVKRYSSGMYVRLAFAVAAHLEPEILIVDEVLAVGDASFQKKCLGKMRDVTRNDGRTILFVSHDLAAVTALTHRCAVMEKGRVGFFGPTDEAAEYYFGQGEASGDFCAAGSRPNQIAGVTIETSESKHTQRFGAPMRIRIRVRHESPQPSGYVTVIVRNQFQHAATQFWAHRPDRPPFDHTRGETVLTLDLPKVRLNVGRYTLSINFSSSKGGDPLDSVEEGGSFDVVRLGETVPWGWHANHCVYYDDVSWRADTD